jgi:hypothetical protein
MASGEPPPSLAWNAMATASARLALSACLARLWRYTTHCVHVLYPRAQRETCMKFEKTPVRLCQELPKKSA